MTPVSIVSFLAFIFSSILSTGIVKAIIEKIASAISGQVQKLSHIPKLVIGYVIPFLFLILTQSGVIPVPDSIKPDIADLNKWYAPLFVKAIYDLVNDLITKYGGGKVSPIKP